MSIMDENGFVTALKSESLQALQGIPKSDLHSHAGRGGHISFFEKYAGVKITPRSVPFENLSEMNQWLKENVKCHLPKGAEGYLKQIEASFVQAASDNVTVLALSFCVDEIQLLGGMEAFKNTIDGLREKYAPNTMMPRTSCMDLILLWRSILALAWEISLFCFSTFRLLISCCSSYSGRV